jgi:electron transfer flavoprotein beta subunit
MAPPNTTPVLREALSMGGDWSILLSDSAFAGSDGLATSYILSTAIKRLAPYHLILCGDQTVDGATSMVSSQIAELLDIPNLMHVSAIETQKAGVFQVRSQIEHGYFLAEIKPPMVLSVIKEINEPRYITLKNILEGEKKEIQMWSSKDLSLIESWVGLKGSPSRMGELLISTMRRKGEILQGEPSEMAKALADRLHRWGYC